MKLRKMNFKVLFIIVIGLSFNLIVSNVYADEFDDFYQWFQERASEPGQSYNPGKLSSEIKCLFAPDGIEGAKADIYIFSQILEKYKRVKNEGKKYEYVCMTAAMETCQKLHELGIPCYLFHCNNCLTDANYEHYVALYQFNGQWFIADLCYGTASSSRIEDIESKKAHIKKYMKIDIKDFIKDQIGEGILEFECFNPYQSGNIYVENIFDVIEDPDVLNLLETKNLLKIADGQEEISQIIDTFSLKLTVMGRIDFLNEKCLEHWLICRKYNQSCDFFNWGIKTEEERVDPFRQVE